MHDPFEFADELGPARIIHVSEPSVGLKGILVVDNAAAGPTIGGVRMAQDATLEECFRLARAMTFKNAAAGLPHGGGKAVIRADPRVPRERKEPLIRAMAQLLRGVEDYIFAPDMGTDERCMAWVRDEIGRVVGLPRELGGIPLDEIGATGFGLSHAAEVAAPYCDIAIDGARLVVQGFGAVGRHVARFLAGKGAILVAAADSRGAVHDSRGLDIGRLCALKDEGQNVGDYPGAEVLPPDALLGVECDIWIPAARPDVINEGNVDAIRARMVLQGANIPATLEAERRLHERGVLCVPDFIANAGGVICAAMEYRGATERAAMEAIEDRIRRNTEQVLARARSEAILPRQAAEAMARERVLRVMASRRFSLISCAPGHL
jgi:glutamate dehydrogenase (NAD(P)+)